MMRTNKFKTPTLNSRPGHITVLESECATQEDVERFMRLMEKRKRTSI
jgi:hypothetical protein